MPFTEVAEDVWVARYDWFDLNVSLIRGAAGLLVVDTHASALAAREVLDDIARLGAGQVMGVVNTHEHFDHTFGNGEFRAAYGAIPIHAHEVAAERTVAAGLRIKERYREEIAAGETDPRADGLLATEIVPAESTFSSALALDLGDRQVELVHPGRGHTSGDLIVRVPDADLVLAGDLVETSARYPTPGLGGDCYPLEWPLTLDMVLGLTTSASVVVPGHGPVTDRDFVEEQRNTLGIVAETIRDLATRGVPLGDALAAADWPYPRDDLGDAVRRGYEQLPRSQKRLPLV